MQFKINFISSFMIYLQSESFSAILISLFNKDSKDLLKYMNGCILLTSEVGVFNSPTCTPALSALSYTANISGHFRS